MLLLWNRRLFANAIVAQLHNISSLFQAYYISLYDSALTSCKNNIFEHSCNKVYKPVIEQQKNREYVYQSSSTLEGWKPSWYCNSCHLCYSSLGQSKRAWDCHPVHNRLKITLQNQNKEWITKNRAKSMSKSTIPDHIRPCKHWDHDTIPVLYCCNTPELLPNTAPPSASLPIS